MPTIIGKNTTEVIWGTNDAAGDYIYGLAGDDTLEAGNGGDHLYGGLGNDKLYGQGGDDVLDGWSTGQGDDLLDGGSGYDTADYSGDSTAVIVSLSKGYAKGYDIGNDTLAGIDNVIGGEGSDIIHGDDPGFLGIGGLGANILDGRGGDDFLNGWGGNDTLFGGKGLDVLLGGSGDDRLLGQVDNDRLNGGAGNDTLDGGDGFDTADYSFAMSGVKMWYDAAWSGSEGTDTLISIEKVVGSDFDDILSVFQGGDFDTGPGFFSADVIEGGRGADTIVGFGGNDTLSGGDGEDWIYGDGGADVMTGGAGADVFYYRPGPFGNYDVGSGLSAGYRDVITDFQHGVDKLYLSVDANPATAAWDTDFVYVGELPVVGTGRVGFHFEGNNTVVTVSMNDDNNPDWAIQLNGPVQLSFGDFLFD